MSSHLFPGSIHAVCATGIQAVRMAIGLAGVRPGDYVLAPNLGSITAVTAIRELGAEPILIDASLDTWQIDLDLLEEFLMGHTLVNEADELVMRRDGRCVRTVVAVHLAGNLCDLERLQFIARRFYLTIVEDFGGAFGASIHGHQAGTSGHWGRFRFASMPFFSGEGGVVIGPDTTLGAGSAHDIPEDLGETLRALLDDSPKFSHRLESLQARLGSWAGLAFPALCAGAAPAPDILAFRHEKGEDLFLHLISRGFSPIRPGVPVNQIPAFRSCLYLRRDDHSATLSQAGLVFYLPHGDRDDELIRAILDF